MRSPRGDRFCSWILDIDFPCMQISVQGMFLFGMTTYSSTTLEIKCNTYFTECCELFFYALIFLLCTPYMRKTNLQTISMLYDQTYDNIGKR